MLGPDECFLFGWRFVFVVLGVLGWFCLEGLGVVVSWASLGGFWFDCVGV